MIFPAKLHWTALIEGKRHVLGRFKTRTRSNDTVAATGTEQTLPHAPKGSGTGGAQSPVSSTP
jgi:hypothetical protein